jgi:hypothetical protein
VTTLRVHWSRVITVVISVGALLAVAAGSASAQAADPNPGAITLTTGIDFPSVYFFRGIRQEIDPRLTVFPYGDVGIALGSGDGAIKSCAINFGVWNSLNTGSSGTGSKVKTSHYEEDFYAKFTLGFAKGISAATQYTAYTSPNGSFGTVKEVLVTISQASKYAPYATFAFELSGQADGGSDEGVYGEFGVAPSWPLGGGKATLAIPLKVGLSLKNYYEGPSGDQAFGYFDGGALVTVPLTKVPSKFGSWNIHGSVDFLAFGGKDSTTRAFNNGDAGEVIVMGGIGLSY